ncbi:cell division topological specificity factor [Bathymodiolus platifrons methanotrophic gill symbiont]|uniref:cell division topological specificity factor MinE n=1 Tax=Bathymodiolus platifrons methanotrophic gill symbiont TaxID=113268 RepID=UPI000B4206F4|nr:cell division topological specificity factor MinE [Bathymodiolus platifrons methanotrophic gill symbiont]GAW85944.1 cell division topological specificity factor [Bathymodiolus platifrons methanotrophic gill symbiont]GFO77101.1 cell division topological specificity factor [Bathymodiolus platifrons methanotrophic gill symbiont]
MSLLDYFKTTKPNSAKLAKERLRILVAHERSARNQPSYLPELQKELLKVIQKYIQIDLNDVSVTFDSDDEQETLELNIVLPEQPQS